MNKLLKSIELECRTLFEIRMFFLLPNLIIYKRLREGKLFDSLCIDFHLWFFKIGLRFSIREN
jgi:hypothetical protein